VGENRDRRDDDRWPDALSDDEHGVHRKLVATAAKRLSNVIVQCEAKLSRTVTIDPRAGLVNI
jgi:hypothetical protein